MNIGLEMLDTYLRRASSLSDLYTVEVSSWVWHIESIYTLPQEAIEAAKEAVQQIVSHSATTLRRSVEDYVITEDVRVKVNVLDEPTIFKVSIKLKGEMRVVIRVKGYTNPKRMKKRILKYIEWQIHHNT